MPATRSPTGQYDAHAEALGGQRVRQLVAQPAQHLELEVARPRRPATRLQAIACDDRAQVVRGDRHPHATAAPPAAGG